MTCRPFGPGRSVTSAEAAVLERRALWRGLLQGLGILVIAAALVAVGYWVGRA